MVNGSFPLVSLMKPFKNDAEDSESLFGGDDGGAGNAEMLTFALTVSYWFSRLISRLPPMSWTFPLACLSCHGHIIRNVGE